MAPKKATPAPAAKAKLATKPAAKSTAAKTTAAKTTAAKTTTATKTTTAKTGASKTTAVKKSPTLEVKVEAAAAAAVPAAAEIQPTSATIGLKSFAAYVLDDKDNDLRKSGRWPLISDETERSTTFLQYRNVNVLNVMNTNDMEPNRLRLALIGALRYGKPVLFNMMKISVAVTYPRLVEYLDVVKPGLMKAIVDKEFLKEKYYMQLVKDEDGTEYKESKFSDTFMDNFMVILASGTNDFPQEVVENFFIVTVE